MANYRFRITFEDYDDVTRDIEIRPSHTFEDFHYSIHNAIGFDASKNASFYMSDDNWKKGKEITNRDVKEEESEKVSLMKKAKLSDFILDPHQKIYYVFDFSSPWTFRIELVKINREDETGATYPRCIKAVGEAPKQYPVTTAAALPLPEDFDEIGLLDDEEETEEETGDILAVETEDLPEGEEKDDSFVTSEGGTADDEFEEAGDDIMEDGSLASDDE